MVNLIDPLYYFPWVLKEEKIDLHQENIPFWAKKCSKTLQRRA